MSAPSTLARSPRPRLTARGVALVAAAYVALALFYVVTIEWYELADGPGHFFANVWDNLPRVLWDYALKGLLTLPVWWLVVRQLDGRPRLQLLAHAALWPLWVWAWFALYRVLSGPLGYFVLEAGRNSWDVYIPALIYAAQFGAFHAVQYVAEVRRRAEAETALVDAARRAELSALKAKLNPHFLFNTLNSVSASVPPEAEHTRSLVSRLAHLMRYALDASDRDLVLMDEELRFTRSYLALEGERLGDRLRVEWDVDADARGVPVPPMLVQPLVENAVRHGIAPSVEGGEVRVGVRLRETTLAVEVRDTGRGLASGVTPEAALGRGVGLGTTHARLQALGAGGVDIDAAPGEPGFAVSFALEVDRGARLTRPLAPEAHPAGASGAPAPPLAPPYSPLARGRESAT